MKSLKIILLTLFLAGNALAKSPYPADWPYTPITTPNGRSLEWTVENGVKVFKLVTEEIEHEMAPGTVIKAWGFNGGTPGPTIEVVQGDRVRILVENKLPEAAAVHWHGLFLPSGMDGVAGLSQPAIPPGQTFVYEFTINQDPGTQMYHAHADEMIQIGLGTMGMFIIHPKDPNFERVDRDFAIFLNEWHLPPGAFRPDPTVMTDFNLFSFNSRIFPGTDALIAKTGQKVRFRFGSVSQDLHPIHVHGHRWKVTGNDAGPIPASARYYETTIVVAPGQTRDVVIENAVAGDWALHCHRRHHPMNAMGHEIPNMIGVSQDGLEERIQELVPGYMAMGETGMHEHAEHAEHMEMPVNTIPMMTGDGPFGTVAMGGMFTVFKVRDQLSSYTDKEAGWYRNPPGTVARPVGTSQNPPQKYEVEPPSGGAKPGHHQMQTTTPSKPMDHQSPEAQGRYTCPMHPEVVSDSPGQCPKCGMNLVPMKDKKGEPSGHEH
jgi:manganese oxidase